MDNLNSLPRLPLAHVPTPIEALPRLSEALNGPVLMIKRDDQTGLAFGGNKTRKLELLAAEASLHSTRTLITRGAAQSNHCRQTAAAAAKCGFGCTLVLAGDCPEKFTGNLLLDHILGADLIWTGERDPEAVLQETFAALGEAGAAPFLIPYGGSNPTGALAYTLAMKEWLAQETPADRIVFATSSGGTQAGLILGAKIYGFNGRITGISVDKPASILGPEVVRLANDIAAKIKFSGSIKPEDVEIIDKYLGEGYGVIGEPETEAIKLFAQTEGILLDPVYTGRAAAGLIDCIRKGIFPSTEKILFWHTGGTPGLFAYAEELSAP